MCSGDILFPQKKGGTSTGYALVFPLFAMMSCAVALPFHVFLEMPCIRLGRRIGTATPATRSKAATAKEELEALGSRGL